MHLIEVNKREERERKMVGKKARERESEREKENKCSIRTNEIKMVL